MARLMAFLRPRFLAPAISSLKNVAIKRFTADNARVCRFTHEPTRDFSDVRRIGWLTPAVIRNDRADPWTALESMAYSCLTSSIPEIDGEILRNAGCRSK